MRVKELMTKKVITIGPEDNVDRVFFLFHFESIRHLPVVEKGKLVGMLSDRDLKKILGPRKNYRAEKDGRGTMSISSRKIKTIMRRGVITIGPEEKAADAAAIMAKRKIGALPVMKNDKLAGIITATDILRAFVKLTQELEKLGRSM